MNSTDPAMAMLAGALGVEEAEQIQLLGHRVRLTIEWPDGEPSDADMAALREIARGARERFWQQVEAQ